MAVRSKPIGRARRARRSPTGRQTRDPRTWERTRATVGIFLFLAAFAWLFIVNGSYTSAFFQASRGWSVEQGWAGHLIISAVETIPAFVIPFLPAPARPKARIILLILSLPFGVLDVLSSSLGVQHDLLGDTFTPDMNVLAVVLGSAVAHAPERAFVYLITLLWYVWKGKYE